MTAKRATPAYVQWIITVIAVLMTVALTAVAFWLSYEHLHDVADAHGLSDTRAWAWPATLDMFIVIGELLILLASLRQLTDWWAWTLTGIGSVGSIVLNVTGVGQGADPMDYVVAAVPPVAALLAFGILMRQLHTMIVAYMNGESRDTEVPDEKGRVPIRPAAPFTPPPVRRPLVPVVPVRVRTLPIVAAFSTEDLSTPVPDEFMNRKGHDPAVYFLRNGDRVKIGTTTNLYERVKHLAHRMEDVLLVLPGGRDLEDDFHQEFRSLRVARTEWFLLGRQIVSYLQVMRDSSREEADSGEDDVTGYRGAVPDPAVPDPAVPDPAVPDPAVPDPAVPDPAVPDPAVPDPAVPDPAVPDPAVPDPVKPRTRTGGTGLTPFVLAGIEAGTSRDQIITEALTRFSSDRDTVRRLYNRHKIKNVNGTDSLDT